ncbi:MAG TPA: hypothetical protein VGB85_29505 [Nannocystis sp.]
MTPASRARLVVPLLAALLALVACRPEPAATTTAPPTPAPVSALAGFDGPVEDDPVAKEATALSEGPLTQCAEKDAAGMQMEGDLIASKLAPGQVLEQEFRLQPGRCYTLIAVGGEGIKELDATFETIGPVRSKSTVLASDALSGTTAVVGGGEACFAWKPESNATPAKFVLRVRGGDGVVVSQLYARDATTP